MRSTLLQTKQSFLKACILSLFLCLGMACSKDDTAMEDDLENVDPQEEGTDTENDPADGNDDDGNDDPDPNSGNDDNCSVGDYIFNEANGLVLVEFENAEFPSGWELRTNESGYSGDGFMVWTGSQNLSNPGTGLTTFKIKINNPGTYQFIWRSAVTIGSNGTDHNDSWLRFPDADDFFGLRDNSKVYPSGSGKTPNPAGASKEGWFKIYRGGNDLSFKWQSSTYDNNSHDIYVDFDAAGVYTMEISARSSGHAIDQFVLFKAPQTKTDAIASGNTFSTFNCN